MDQNSLMMLVDGDTFEEKNASRMLFSNYGNKAAVTLGDLRPHLKHGNLAMATREDYVTKKNIWNIIQTGDIVILCVDNHATRKLVNDHCAKLKDILLISGGNDGVGKTAAGAIRRGTYGNVQVYARKKGKDLTPSLSKFHPEIAHPADKPPSELNCTDLIVSQPQILFSNLQVAASILNTLMLCLSGAMHYGELSFDIAEGLMQPTIKV